MDLPPVVDSKISEQFNAADTDVTFRSCDNVDFRIHRKNLETETGAFPGPEFDTRGEAVPLSETAEVLELLFRFVYPEHKPFLQNLSFATLAFLAEAAEKYEVYPSMKACHIEMTRHINKHPTEVMIYAARHDYPELVDKAGPLMVVEPLHETLELLPSSFRIPWIKYYQKWVDIWNKLYFRYIKENSSSVLIQLQIAVNAGTNLK